MEVVKKKLGRDKKKITQGKNKGGEKMKLTLNKFSTLLILIILVFSFAPAVFSSSQVTIGLAAGMSNWDPHDDIPTHVTGIKRNVYETLTIRNDDMGLEPLLAKNWEPIDEKIWRFYLQEGVEFHNGLPFTAHDVKFSLERLANPELGLHGQSFVATILKVEVIDDLTVDIHTRIMDPVLPSRLAFCGFIVPEKTFNELGRDEFVRNPIGTGPYTLTEFVRDERIVLDRFEGYWGESTKSDRVIFRPIPEVSTRIAALEAGEIDLAEGVPPDLVARIRQNQNLSIKTVRSGRNVFMILNTNNEPLDNKLVRQAMNYAVDVPTIINFLFGGLAHQVPVFGSPAVTGYVDSVDPYPYDPEKAMEMLEEAGYPNGFETTVAIAIGRPFASQDITLAIAQYLSRVGIKLNIVTYDWGEFLQRWLSGEYPMYYMGFGTPVMEIDDFIGGYFDPSRRATWGHPPEEIIALGRKALETFDEEERAEIYREYYEGIKDFAPHIFLLNFDEIYGVWNNVVGFNPRPDEQINTRTIGLE